MPQSPKCTQLWKMCRKIRNVPLKALTQLDSPMETKLVSEMCVVTQCAPI